MEIKRKIADNIDINERIDYNDNLELVTLRWKYLLRSPNPDSFLMEQSKPIIEKVSKENWNKFNHVYYTVGYDLDDITNIARCHTVSFFGVFSVRTVEEHKEKFVNWFRNKNGEDTYPSEKDFIYKDMYNLQKFLIQRMEEVAKVCFQKNRNIRGTKEIFKIFKSNKPVNVEDAALIENPERYNFKEITKKLYNDIKKKNDIKGDQSFFVGNMYIRVVSVAAQELQTADFLDQYLTDATEFYKNPERKMFEKENKAVLMEYKDTYNQLQVEDKTKLLKDFINQHKTSKYMKEEVEQAKAMLKGL